MAATDARPGYRRRFVVTPLPDRVTAALEDDIHCMAVTLRHDGGVVEAVEAQLDRLPWTTCPGAAAVLQTTFTGVALRDVAARGAKKANCTHLHDLAVLAAAHAFDAAPLIYDITSADPVGGLIEAEIRRDGAPVLAFAHRDHVMTAPAEVAGLSLFKLRDWIDTLASPEREAARLLQWGSIVAQGRLRPLDQQSDARQMPPNCFTFQPENAAVAHRVGKIFDFSTGDRAPLDHFDGERFGEVQPFSASVR